jgi:uncharacterized membrane protein
MHFTETVEAVGKAIDGLGVGLAVVGIVGALVIYALGRDAPGADRYRELRRRIGRSILLGLELLVAGDIIRTVAISPTFTSVGVLAAIVAIRTFLSFTLELEISGRWPWQPVSKPD